MIYFSTWKGLKSSSVVAYVTVPLPYIMLTILLIKGVSLPGASIGLKFLFYPDWSKLGNLKVWEDAFVQIAYSSGIAFGPLMLYGSARKPNEKLITSCIVLPIINSASSIYAAITIFSFLGHVSQTLDIPLSEISDGGLDLAFIAYPGLLTMLPGANFWSVCFFIMLVTIGIDSIFGGYEFTLTYIYEMFPKIREMYTKEVFCLIMTIVYFLLGLIFTLNSGYWWFELFNFYSAGLTLVLLMIVETIIISWVFGIDRLEELLT
jgi:SNF family Na+-dependent transporter